MVCPGYSTSFKVNIPPFSDVVCVEAWLLFLYVPSSNSYFFHSTLWLFSLRVHSLCLFSPVHSLSTKLWVDLMEPFFSFSLSGVFSSINPSFCMSHRSFPHRAGGSFFQLITVSRAFRCNRVSAIQIYIYRIYIWRLLVGIHLCILLVVKRVAEIKSMKMFLQIMKLIKLIDYEFIDGTNLLFYLLTMSINY